MAETANRPYMSLNLTNLWISAGMMRPRGAEAKINRKSYETENRNHAPTIACVNELVELHPTLRLFNTTADERFHPSKELLQIR